MKTCTDCGHSTGWGSGGRGRGCDTTTDSGPCNSDYRNCNCTNNFHDINRCPERKETFTVAEMNDWRARWPFMKDGRCGNASYAGTGPCETHISKIDKMRVDLKREEDQVKWVAERDQRIKDEKLADARKLLEAEGYAISK